MFQNCVAIILCSGLGERFLDRTLVSQMNKKTPIKSSHLNGEDFSRNDNIRLGREADSGEDGTPSSNNADIRLGRGGVFGEEEAILKDNLDIRLGRGADSGGKATTSSDDPDIRLGRGGARQEARTLSSGNNDDIRLGRDEALKRDFSNESNLMNFKDCVNSKFIELFNGLENVPKQYYKIAGKEIFLIALETMSKLIPIENIVLTVSQDNDYAIKNLILNILPESLRNVKICKGGRRRQDSVLNGLKCLSTLPKIEHVLIHDGARPFIPKGVVEREIQILNEENNCYGVICGTPVTDTLKKISLPLCEIDNSTMGRELTSKEKEIPLTNNKNVRLGREPIAGEKEMISSDDDTIRLGREAFLRDGLTIQYYREKGAFVQETVSRERLYGAQTPQGFNFCEILRLHKKYKDIDVTDDCSLMELEKHKVQMIDGSIMNIKITRFEDYILAKEMYEK